MAEIQIRYKDSRTKEDIVRELDTMKRMKAFTKFLRDGKSRMTWTKVWD